MRRLMYGTLCLTVALLLAACGGGGGSSNPVSPGNGHTVGGTVSGLSGTVVLQNNHGDNLSVTHNGAFTFANPVTSGSTYSVTVLAQPAGQNCSVSNYAGTISGTAVTNVAVSCAATIPPTISVTISPSKTAIAAGGAQDFLCTVKGATDLGCSFSVLGSNTGTVSTTGHYVAPSTAGTYTVVATSHADGSKTDTATVNVSAVPIGADPTKPDVPQGMDVTLSVDTTAGQHPISPYIFGINGASSSYATFNGTGRNNGNGSGCAGREFEAMPSIAMPAGRFGANRFGANRSPWNWETDISSAGMDAPGSLDFWESDTFLCTPYSHSVAGAAKGVLEDAITTGTNAAILTMPMIGWVPKANGTVANPVAPDVNTPATSLDANFWVRELPSRSSVTPANAGAIQVEATATPNTSDAYSYQEDFVEWLDVHYGAGNTRDGINRWTTEPGRIVIQLDNEPDLWGNDTHPEVRGVISGGTCNDSSGAGCVFTGYDELVQKTVDHAAMTKAIAPDALVMSGSWATWTGLVKGNPNMPQTIQAWATAHGDTGTYSYYAQYYLKKLHDAEAAWASVLNGRRLVDIFDFHPYVQSNTVSNQDGNNVYQTTAVVNERIDYARTFWDPSYVENSWVPGSLPDCTNGGGCAVQMVPRFKKWMTDAGFTTWPDDPNGMKIGFTEWALYRQGDVSNAVGVADILGVFAREGVYLSTYWPMGLNTTPYQCTGAFANAYPDTPTCPRNRSVACLHAAYKAWRAFDGANGSNGDTYVKSTSSDPVLASVYGTMNAGDTSKAVIIALNRRDTALNAGLSVANLQAFHKAQWYQVTGGNGANASCSGPNRLPDVGISLNNAFTATLPAYSINVFVLTP